MQKRRLTDKKSCERRQCNQSIKHSQYEPENHGLKQMMAVSNPQIAPSQYIDIEQNINRCKKKCKHKIPPFDSDCFIHYSMSGILCQNGIDG